MNFNQQLAAELSHKNMHFVAHCVGKNEAYFREIIELLLHDKDPVPARAAWVAEIVTIDFPYLIDPYLHDLIEALPRFTHPGSQRNTLKILSRNCEKIEDEDDQGYLIDLCFTWIKDQDITVAVKIFSMDIITSFVKVYPELAYELQSVIEDQFNKNSAGFKSRGRKTLKEIGRYIG